MNQPKMHQRTSLSSLQLQRQQQQPKRQQQHLVRPFSGNYCNSSCNIIILFSTLLAILLSSATANGSSLSEAQDGIQSGALNQSSVFPSDIIFAPVTSPGEQKPRRGRPSNLANAKHSNDGDQNKHDVNRETSRRTFIRRQDETPSTDCNAKRNEILNRKRPSRAATTTSQLQGYQKLRPKLESSQQLVSNETLPLATTNFDGEHIPRCNQQGYYEPIQCHKIGYCWCVNKYGQAIKNSAVMEGLPYCDPSIYESESNNLLVVAGISAQRIKHLLKNGGTSESTTPNGHIDFEAESPVDGTNPVDAENGQQVGSIDSTTARRTEPTLPLALNDCRSSRQSAIERASKQINDNIWVPDCDPEDDKHYAERQCHRSKVCWCVDQSTGLPLRTGDQLTGLNVSNCTELKWIVEMSNAKSNLPKPQPAFYFSSSESCDAERRIEFVTLLNSQFRQQIGEYVKQIPTSSLPHGLGSINPFTVNESQVSKWIFSLMDKDLDEKLGDREWSKFKNNFKLVDKLEEFDHPSKQPKSSYMSLVPLSILRSQRKCWRDFLEFCGNGDLVTGESVSLSKWLSCTELPSRSNNRNHNHRGSPGLIENNYAHSPEAAIIRSKKKNPFLGILKPD